MINKKNCVRYDEALTDNEILLYSQIVDQFKHDKIDFSTLKSMFLSYGVTVQPVLYNFSKIRMTSDVANKLKKRLSSQNYFYGDIFYFILNSDKFSNVIFCIDYKAIELLANAGVYEYQETLIAILRAKLRFSYNKNDKVALERSKWKRRIEELEKELANNNKKVKKYLLK